VCNVTIETKNLLWILIETSIVFTFIGYTFWTFPAVGPLDVWAVVEVCDSILWAESSSDSLIHERFNFFLLTTFCFDPLWKIVFIINFKDSIKYGNSKIVKQTLHEANNKGVKTLYYKLNMGEAVMVVLQSTNNTDPTQCKRLYTKIVTLPATLWIHNDIMLFQSYCSVSYRIILRIVTNLNCNKNTVIQILQKNPLNSITTCKIFKGLKLQ